ncbi:BrnA antitoxin family protein [Agrobacterium rhizogenes]|nr:BrnA antitoxin family protein [Rhizobium rhizogenes]
MIRTKLIEPASIPKPKADKEPPSPRGRGRPSSGKETVTLRVSAEAVAVYRSFGDDWRDQMAADLATSANLKGKRK